MKMTERYNKIEIADFPADLEFEGYLWYSDASKPKVNGEIDKANMFTALPFIVEGNLYAEKEQISIQIKYIDGEYHIAKINLKDLDLNATDDRYDVKAYMARSSRVGEEQYKMLEAWKVEEDKDGYLAGMATLAPAWSAFIGFTNQEKSNK